MPVDNTPAFPQNTAYLAPNGAIQQQGPQGGLTLRDYFAAKAMQGLLASPTDPTSFDAIGVFAYNCADAMLKARGQQ